MLPIVYNTYRTDQVDFPDAISNLLWKGSVLSGFDCWLLARLVVRLLTWDIMNLCSVAHSLQSRSALLCSYLLRTISWLKAPAAGCRVWLGPDCHRRQFWTQNSHSDTCYQNTSESQEAAEPDSSPDSSPAAAAAAAGAGAAAAVTATRGQRWSRETQQWGKQIGDVTVIGHKTQGASVHTS